MGMAVLALVAAVAWPREREPVYQGKKLSEWLRACEKQRYVSLRGEHDAFDAVRNIGTNALPWFVKWMQYEPPKWNDSVRVVLARLHLRSYLSFRQRRRAGPAELRADAAAGIGFQILGPQSGPVIPELVRLLENTNSPATADRAKNAFTHMGEDVVPPLMAMLTNQASSVRAEAAHCIGAIGGRSYSLGSSRYMPALVQALGDPDSKVREQATNALSRIAPKFPGTGRVVDVSK